MIGVVLLSFLTLGTTEVRAEGAVGEIVAALRARNEKIQTISCQFWLDETWSELAIASRAKHDGRTLEDVRRQYDTPPSSGVFEETRTGLFRLEHARLDHEGKPTRLRAVFFDGRQPILMTTGLEAGGLGVSDVRVNGNVRASYEAESAIRRLLGETVLSPGDRVDFQVRPLFTRIEGAESSERLPQEAVGGVDCWVVRWTNDLSNPSAPPKRETVWLDPRHGLAIRRYQEESRPTDRKDWSVTESMEVETLSSTPFGSGDPEMQAYWYPSRFVCRYTDASGDLMLATRWEVRSLALKATIPTARFKPVIEDGSNVKDEATGRSFVYGGGLSPRLKKLIYQRLDMSKRSLQAETDVQAVDGVLSHRRRWTGVVSWIALALGGAGLLGALWMRRRA